MDTNLLDFLRTKVNSFIKWDLVRFFHDNPHARDTAENIARYMARDVRTIDRELSDLAGSQVVVADEISGAKVYHLTEDADTRATISAFMDACHDREFRVEAIYQVIQGMRFSPRHDF
jgi:hypothetical protein